MPGLLVLLTALASLPIFFALRVYLLLPSPAAKAQSRARGHTSEMKALLSSLDFERYQPRTYIYCHGDNMSLNAVAEIESQKGSLTHAKAYNLLPLPRARRVGQPALSTSISVIKTLIVTVHHLLVVPLLTRPTEPFADLLIVNGPGTCVVLVVVAWIRRILGLSYTKIIYVESFARVQSLSMSGKLVRPFVDRFLVQWPQASDRKAECKGWLV
ncbi:hypothetical protein B9479_002686 [Cryptococcus floricola]|uniref:UDP-N-acetylglucosamine transferase subunit ALG14 n=1 Tax=Cryptococcus floricola TaxID=2591691 RepID=A0A5D3B1H9_9TREE|nr:hypothetical protein B9479_002686 [Cryptococcus floricola]